MVVRCARCGDPYNNSDVVSQEEADQKLEVCDRCYVQVVAEIQSAEIEPEG